ncbi:MAG TPA: L,D-transpeptidase family protein [Alphaproteobacteria bacterium]|nr:L,D-transpeptidase family protein [Alphaproteobacteria bacterium]
MTSRLYQTFLAFCIVIAAAAMPFGKASAQLNPPDNIADTLGVENLLLVKAGITQALEVGRVGKLTFHDGPGMKAFYEARGYESAWLQSSFLRQQKAEALVEAFENSWKHGLNPASYHVEEIKRLMSETQGAERFELDLVLSDALVRYGRDLTGMRVNPKAIGQRSKYWREPLRGIDILDHVANASDARSALAGLAPQGNLYKKLQRELISLYNTPAEDPDTQIIRLTGLLRPGNSHKAILKIRQRMGFDPAKAPQGAYYYDDELAQAVMSFQKAHGLTPDAIIGAHTIKLMNMTRDDRINQVLVNLERLRWMEPNKPDRYIMVNVPAAILWAVEDGRVKIEMPVVVGREERPTNIFTTEITGVRFNPTWTVPPTIKRDDYLPKLREDPYYLSDRGIELMDGNMTVDPGLVDWNEKTWSEVNQMRMVQGSGANNPLGLVRVIMNNPFNIYLHDTPTKSYFKRSNRALSSGCIRLQDAQKVADFILSHNDNWSQERKEQILAKGKQVEVAAQDPLPVYILYQTVWLGDREQIVYGPDLYGEDRKLLKALTDIGGVVFPADDKSIKTAQINDISPAAGVDLLSDN